MSALNWTKSWRMAAGAGLPSNQPAILPPSANRRRDDDERRRERGCDRVPPARPPRTAEHVVPVRVHDRRRHESVEPVVEVCLAHRATSWVSACRSVRRAVESVAPTVPGLMPSAAAIVA